MKDERIKIRKRHLRNRYGITLEQYGEMYENQRGLCMICEEKKDVLCVDHCHSGGAIRGLLCHNCNRALGMLKDNVDIINRAILYLRNKL